MTPFSCLPNFARSTTSPQSFLSRHPHLYVPKYRYNETKLPKKENPLLPPFLLPTRPYLHPLLTSTNHSKPNHPFASISSFADAEGGKEQSDQGEDVIKTNNEDDADDLPGMAQAFHISSRTASAIAIFIAFAALSLPFFMKSLGQGLSLKTKFLSYATLLFGFYMAWNIGANDVANAMGTSVGSGALTLRQAVLTAAILEFSGALLMGTHVTSTMQKGILVANVFQGKDSLLFAGLLSSLAAAGTWLQVVFSYKFHISSFNFWHMSALGPSHFNMIILRKQAKLESEMFDMCLRLNKSKLFHGILLLKSMLWFCRWRNTII